MELNQLKIFVAVAEEKHLTRAAERLFTSQPAVSAQIKSLEEQLGLPLFERTPKGMTLTPAGEQLLRQAEATLSSAAQLLNTAKNLQGQVMGSLLIGTNSDADFLRLPQLSKRLSERHPQIEVSMTQSMSALIVPDIRKGKLDSGFFFGPCTYADLHKVELEQTQTAIVAPIAWKEKIEHADIEAISQLPWVYTTESCPFFALKETLFENSGFHPKKSVFVDTEDNIRAFIKAEAGISLLREDDADKAEKEGWGCRWHGKTPSCSLSVAVRVNRLQEPLMQAWISTLKEIWEVAEQSQQQVI